MPNAPYGGGQISTRSFSTREAARRVIFDYIEVFYNQIRRHARIGYLAPAEFVRQFYANLKKAA
jgi:transposase InsO family protein